MNVHQFSFLQYPIYKLDHPISSLSTPRMIWYGQPCIFHGSYCVLVVYHKQAHTLCKLSTLLTFTIAQIIFTKVYNCVQKPQINMSAYFVIQINRHTHWHISLFYDKCYSCIRIARILEVKIWPYQILLREERGVGFSITPLLQPSLLTQRRWDSLCSIKMMMTQTS